jgi:hypothetical protein
MKPIIIVPAILLLTFTGLLLVVLLNSEEPDPPQFKKFVEATPGPQPGQISYPYLDERPFEAGKLWVSVIHGIGYKIFLYDIERKKVLGEMVNGSPVTMVNDTEVVCMKVGQLKQSAYLRKIRFLIERWTRGVMRFGNVGQHECYWVLNLNNNRARKLGHVPHTGSFNFVASPQYHYGYKPVFAPATNGAGVVEYYLFNLKRKSIQKIALNATVCGWWDDTHILLQSTNSAFSLYNIKNKRARRLPGFAEMKSVMAEKATEPSLPAAFHVWNGSENDFYLTDMRQKLLATRSFLMKLQRSDERLKLISPNFQFEHYDHFDSSGRYYVYTGDTEGGDSDGIYVRELGNPSTDYVLVKPTSDKSFSVPQLYKDSVIYIRSNAIWRINLNGSNNTRLFPN